MQDEPRKTPLYDEHRRLGGRLVPFAGFSLPVQYEGIVEEHRAVRERAGIFDVSHMGELEVRGPDAVAAVDALVTNDVQSLAIGKALYTLACNVAGGILDDLIVYRLEEDAILIVCNASNHAKMAAHFGATLRGDVRFVDRTDATALLALQGPRAVDVMTAAGATSAREMPTFGLAHLEVGGVRCLVARTGYTGEDGFELFCRNDDAAALFRCLLERGAPLGLSPCGLGARDTLRLEAKLALYGHELDEQTNPFEAGLSWVVKLDRGDFLGRDALRSIAAHPPARRLVGFEMVGRGIARHGYPIVAAGAPVGVVTSGSPSPTLGKNIGLGYVPPSLAGVGTELGIEIRGKVIEARVVKTPFYRRQR